MAVKNQVQLITYPDSLGGNLKNLNSMLTQYFLDIFDGGLHIVSPFKLSLRKDFESLSSFEIEPDFGTWEDIKTIGRKFDVMLDITANHIFSQSEYFKGLLMEEKNSLFADYIITLNEQWKDGELTQDDIDKLKELFIEAFAKFSKNNVKMISLNLDDCIISKLRSNCYFNEAEIYKYADWIKKTADSFGIELLSEVHAYYSVKYKLAEHGYWIHDFILPYTIFDAITNKSSEKLNEYLKNRPVKQFTLIDWNNGIPSYYATLNCDEDAYLASRAIQFFVPGIPQVYLASLLKVNNEGLFSENAWIRCHIFSRQSIEDSLKKEVVQRLLKLIRFRNEYPAFDGKFNVLSSNTYEVHLSWKKDNRYCELFVDFETNNSKINYIDDYGEMIQYLI